MNEKELLQLLLNKFGDFENKLSTLENNMNTKFDNLQGQINNLDDKFDTKFDNLQGQINSLDDKFDNLQQQVDTISNEVVKTRLILENTTNRNINLLVEVHDNHEVRITKLEKLAI